MEICERPPGGACTLVLERPVMTLPAFWFEPVAKALDEVEALFPAAWEVPPPNR